MERAIDVLSDIQDVNDLLRGAGVDQVRLVPDAGSVRLEVELTRAMPELAATVRSGLMTRTKTPWTKSRLQISKIKASSLRRLGDGEGQLPLVSCEAVPGGYSALFNTPDGMQLKLEMEQLSGRFWDLGSPTAAP